jgi:soluble lytic murein transglycosylase-like protein
MEVYGMFDSIPLNDTDKQYVQDVCRQYNVASDLIFAMMATETGDTFKLDVVNADGSCIGPMQVNVKCHQDRAKRLGVKLSADDWQGSVLVAVDYVAELFAKYEDVGDVLMAYNGGEGYLRRMKDKGIYSTKYTEKVFARQEEYYSGSQ